MTDFLARTAGHRAMPPTMPHLRWKAQACCFRPITSAAWATSIVAPPDGAMSDYMASLDRLLERQDRVLLPGHGGPVTSPKTFMRGLKAHRKMRERAIFERLKAGDRTIAAIVAAIYRDTDPRLHGAAALSVLAHLEDLVSRGAATTDGEPRLTGLYFPG